MNYTNCISLKKSRSLISNIGIDLEDFLQYSKNSSLKSGNFIVSNSLQKYSILSNCELKNRTIKPLIIDACIRAESISAGAGVICLSMIKNGLIKKYKYDSEKIENQIISISKRFSESDFEKLILKNLIKPFQIEIMKFIKNNVGFNSPIFLERSNKNETTIKITEGHQFNTSVKEGFLKSKKTSFQNPNVVVMDAYIESVSEIHHLLEKASETKEAYFIFARHISKEVLNTLILNFRRGTIKVFPVCVGFDENTLNILNDISICTGSDLISSLKGDLISSGIKENISQVKKIDITENYIVIDSKDSNRKVKNHIKYLKNRRDNSVDSSMYDIFDKRIKSLTSGKVDIKIGVDAVKDDPQTIERFDETFRIIKSLSTFGVIYKKDLKGATEIYELLDEDFPYSCMSIISAVKNSSSAINSLNSIGTIVYNEE